MVRSKKGSLIEHLISPDILLEHSVTDLHSKIDVAKPYGHLQIHNLFDKKLLILAQEEAKVNLTADFKESDLFKLFQTIDLGNFDSKDKKVKSKLPHLYQLKEYIYSVEFRNFISQITDVKDLIDRVDCSINIYTNGCHLLCHDDVIGTRRVSFIIYLTDPYEEWNYEDGGGLELYPLDPSSITEGAECKYNLKHTQGVPTPNPTTILLPSFNSMVLFPVQPGRSYHSVQEVYSDKPRMSISGWYHGATPPLGSDHASLKLIMTRGDDYHSFVPFSDLNSYIYNTDKEKKKPIGKHVNFKSSVSLNESELEYLSQYLNPEYLKQKVIKNINLRFCEESSLQLRDFLRIELVSQIKNLISDLFEFSNNENINSLSSCLLSYEKGIRDEWCVIGPAHKRRYLQFRCSDQNDIFYNHFSIIKLLDVSFLDKLFLVMEKNSSLEKSKVLGYILYHIQENLFQSKIFAKYLYLITSLEPISYRSEIRRFRSGLDYTVAHYGDMSTESILDATLCFVAYDPLSVAYKLNSNSSSSSKKEIRINNNTDDESDNGYNAQWVSGDVGGFECYIEAEENADEAEASEVFQSSSSSGYNKNKRMADKFDNDHHGNDSSHPIKKQILGQNKSTTVKTKSIVHTNRYEDKEISSEDQSSSSLLSVSPGFNLLSLVMRDEKVMRFVKYLSKNAPSDRWDIALEYQFKK